MPVDTPRGPLSASCPTRDLLDQLADKWSVLILVAVRDGPLRFNALQRVVEGITQKMLGQTLRRLERNGLVNRHVITLKPIAVEYGITELGQGIGRLVEDLRIWAIANVTAVSTAQKQFDAKLDRGPRSTQSR